MHISHCNTVRAGKGDVSKMFISGIPGYNGNIIIDIFLRQIKIFHFFILKGVAFPKSSIREKVCSWYCFCSYEKNGWPSWKELN